MGAKEEVILILMQKKYFLHGTKELSLGIILIQIILELLFMIPKQVERTTQMVKNTLSI